MWRGDRKGQSFLQYGLLIIVIAAALISMRIYATRSLQERYRQAADVFGQGEQYEPGLTTVSDTVNTQEFVSPDEAGIGVNCNYILARVDDVIQQIDSQKKTVEELESKVSSIESHADELEHPTNVIIRIFYLIFHPDVSAQVEALRSSAAAIRQQIGDLNKNIAALENDIDSDRQQYPQCFEQY